MIMDAAVELMLQDERGDSTDHVNKVGKRNVAKQSSKGGEGISFDQEPGLEKMCEMMEQAYALMVEQCKRYDENHSEMIQTLGKTSTSSDGHVKSVSIFGRPKPVNADVPTYRL